MPKPTKPTPKNAALAMCHRCMGYWSDGIADCTDYTCPLYSWQIRADKSKVDTTWMDYNPKRKGLVTWEECERDLSDEEREKIADRFRSASSKADDSLDDEFDDELEEEDDTL